MIHGVRREGHGEHSQRDTPIEETAEGQEPGKEQRRRDKKLGEAQSEAG